MTNELTTKDVGLIRLDHTKDSVDDAFLLLPNEVKDLNDFINKVSTDVNKHNGSRTEVIERIWNCDKLSLYARIRGICKWSYDQGVSSKTTVK